jgi:hypothetical protein
MICLDTSGVYFRQRFRIVLLEPREYLDVGHRNLVPRQSVTVKIPRSRY